MRVGQSHKASVIESIANLAVGLVISLILNWAILRAQGHPVSWGEMSWLAGAMTIASIVRSYTMRRIFNWMFEKDMLP